MPTRFLSDEQRRRYGRYAGEPTEEQLDRYFHLDEADRAIVARLRGDHNRLGFAAQLGTVRFLGTFLDDPTDVPSSVLATMAEQLAPGRPPALDGYRQGRQRWRHVALIRDRYGYRDFALDGQARFRLTRWLYALCWAGDDRPSLLIDRATAWLVGDKVLLPGISTIERLVAQVRHRASRRAWRILAATPTREQRQRIETLLDAERGELTMTLERLRAAPTRRSPTELIRSLERLSIIRARAIRPTIPEGFPPAALLRLARFGHRVKPAVLAHLPEPRRTATLVALLHSLEATAQDDAVELFEALAAEVVGDAAKAHQQARLRTLRDLDGAALKLAKGWRLLLRDTPPPADWQEHVFDAVPRAEIEAAMERVETLVRPDDACHYEELRRRWRRVRHIFAALLGRVSFGASPAAEPVKKAIDYLRALEESWSDAAMRDAPMGAVGRVWRRHVLDARGRVDPRAYVFAVLESFREALKRREIFARPASASPIPDTVCWKERPGWRRGSRSAAPSAAPPMPMPNSRNSSAASTAPTVAWPPTCRAIRICASSDAAAGRSWSSPGSTACPSPRAWDACGRWSASACPGRPARRAARGRGAHRLPQRLHPRASEVPRSTASRRASAPCSSPRPQHRPRAAAAARRCRRSGAPGCRGSQQNFVRDETIAAANAGAGRRPERDAAGAALGRRRDRLRRRGALRGAEPGRPRRAQPALLRHAGAASPTTT